MNSIVPSAILNTIASFYKVMEKSGMTLTHVQRVIARPKLRQAIIDLIEADMVRLWQPDPEASKVPTNLDRLTAVFDKPDKHDLFDTTTPLGERLEVVLGIVSEDTKQAIIHELFYNGYMSDPLPFLYYHGLIGNREVTIEELASGFDVQPARIRDRIKMARHRVEGMLRQLLNAEYTAAKLLEAGLVTPEWAAATDDARILNLREEADWFVVFAVNGAHQGPFKRISQLTSLSEAQLRERMAWWYNQNADDEPDPIDEIKAELARFGLSLAEPK